MNYYNEFDKKAAAWLRELIAEGLIPAGDVDERSICDVTAGDLMGYTQCHFFAGIGGWSCALRLAGWPDERPVWTGSCPCQPFSSAGKQKGKEDERHLWPAFASLIRECRPDKIFGEQVASAIRHGWLDGVQADLEGEGYAVGHCVLGAHSVGAPHQRQRLYWMADKGRGQRKQSIRTQGDNIFRSADDVATIPLADAKSIGIRKGFTDTVRCACGSCQRKGTEPIVGCNAIPLSDSNGEQTDTTEQGQRLSCERLPRCPLADSERTGLEGHAWDGNRGYESGRAKTQPNGSTSKSCGVGHWGDFAIANCKDGRARRIPAQSVFQRVVDGVPEIVVDVRTEIGYPICEKIQCGNILLKGYGNAIVPQVAQVFIEAFMDSEKSQ